MSLSLVRSSPPQPCSLPPRISPIFIRTTPDVPRADRTPVANSPTANAQPHEPQFADSAARDMTRDARTGHLIRSLPVLSPTASKPNPGQKSKVYSITFPFLAANPMVGANYTGGRRNAAKARSRDTTGRLQRGHFSKQRLGILTDALRSRRPDHQPLTGPRSRPSAVADHSDLTSNPRSGSLLPVSVYSTCAPAATVYDISLGHAQRDLAQKKLQLPAQHRTSGGPLSQPGQPRPDLCVRNDLPAVTPVDLSTPHALTGKGEPDPAPSSQTLLPPSCATTPSPSHSLPKPNFHQELAIRRGSLLENQPTPVTELPSKPQSKILDLIDISDREHILFLRVPRHPALPLSQLPSPFNVYTACTVPHAIRPPNLPKHPYSYSTFPICPHPLITVLVMILLP